MIIYKDLLSGDELFTDVYPISTDETKCFYKVVGKTVSEASGGIDESLIGGNKSAEDDTGGDVDESSIKTGCNIVLANKLVECPGYDKKGLQLYFKEYCKKVAKKLQEEGLEEKATEFKTLAPAGAKYLLKNLKNLEFFTGEKMDPEASMGYLNYEEDGVTPYLLFFRHALIEEKC